MPEYIIKYSGDLYLPGFDVEALNESYAIITADEGAIMASLLRHPRIEYIEPAKRLFSSIEQGLDQSCIAPVKQKNGFGLTGRGVAVGIIDSGLDTAHPEFRDAQGRSRVLFLWDMGADGTPPAGFRFGAEYNAAQLDAGFGGAGDPIGHGTAVSCIAAGGSGVAPQAGIIAVKLRPHEVRSTDIMRGIKYIIDRARLLQMPCAINLSYGTNDGSHRGGSLFETFVSGMSQTWKTVIVCAAGNEGYGGHHFSGRLSPGQTINVEFSIAMSRPTLYLTLWKNFADDAAYEMISPDGRSSGLLTVWSRTVRTAFDGVTLHAVYGQPTHYTSQQEVSFLFEATGERIPDGIWTLVCRGAGILDGSFHAWLPTIGEVTEKTAFSEPSASMTITLPATAGNVISVGGYRGSTGTISAFSGRGCETCGIDQIRPDLVAPAENILTAKAGGGYGVFTGTSMAAPFVTGSAALMMQWGIVEQNDPFLYGERVKALLCRRAARAPFRSYPNSQWGYGALNLCGAMDDLARLIWR